MYFEPWNSQPSTTAELHLPRLAVDILNEKKKKEGWVKFIARKINQQKENEQINHKFWNFLCFAQI